jgi:homoserine O-succinyltransferase
MTIIFDNPRHIDSPGLAPAGPGGADGTFESCAKPDALVIGLVNNMADSAMQATERQFMRLLDIAAGSRPVRLHLFSLPEVPRSAATRARMAGRYTDARDISHFGPFDGLIVTGAEPRTASLQQEAYWPSLSRLIDWAEANTRSTIWSCLAAHAAVLHLDGIARKPLAQKCSGIFECETVADDNLVRDAISPLKVAHSRLNGLDADELVRNGYRVLTASKDAGVDIFVKDWRSRFVFFQGHQEYDTQSLRGEYLRDIGRYLSREREAYPAIPANYFDTVTEQSLHAFQSRAMEQRNPALMIERPSLKLRRGLAADTHDAAVLVFRSWLDELMMARETQDAGQHMWMSR